MKNKLAIILLFITVLPLSAHKSWTFHVQDMYEVLQLEENPELTSWMKYVSSDLIDGYDIVKAYTIDGEAVKFGEYIRNKYPKLSFPHRYLYHWGFNSRPWTKDWDEKVSGWNEEEIKALQSDLIAEQKRRNGLANEKTENLFQLGHGGKEARIANILISIVYDTHVLGDYEPDNKLLEGLQDISSVVGDIISRCNALDKDAAKDLIKNLKAVSNNNQIDVQEKALQLNIVLKEGFSSFLQTADGGSVKHHLEACGFNFVSHPIRRNVMSEDDLTVNLSLAKTEDDAKASRFIQSDTIVSDVYEDSLANSYSEEGGSGHSSMPIFLLITVIIVFIIVIVVMRRR